MARLYPFYGGWESRFALVRVPEPRRGVLCPEKGLRRGEGGSLRREYFGQEKMEEMPRGARIGRPLCLVL